MIPAYKSDMRSVSASSSSSSSSSIPGQFEKEQAAVRAFPSFDSLSNLGKGRDAQLWGRASSSSSLSSLSSTPSSYRERRGSRASSFVSHTPSSELDDPITYINAVSFDGGGVRGAASAKILEILMDDVSKATGADAHPADFFEMFGGTSTGGLVAVMLGRLRVSAKSLVGTYRNLSSRLFSSKRRYLRSVFAGSKYSGTLAEELFEQIVEDNAPEGGDALLRNTEFGAPDVFVTAVDASDATGDPLVLRSYEVDGEERINYAHRIADAARATTAAPAYFPAKKLGNGTVALDGGLQVNNPTNVLIDEARRRHGRGVRFGLLLSIGTGEKTRMRMPLCSSAASILSFTKAMGHMLTDSERTHLRVEERFRESDLGTYLRINVPIIGDIHLDDYKAIPAIVKATEEYMNTPEMVEIRKEVVERLLDSRAMF